MTDDDQTPPPDYEIMDVDKDVVCIMLDVSKHQKIFGRGRPPMFYELMSDDGPPESLHIDNGLWEDFQRCMQEKGGMPLDIVVKTIVLVIAWMGPFIYWGGKLDAGEPPSTVFTIILLIYLAIMAGVTAMFSKIANAIQLEARKAAVEFMAQELHAAGYAIELVHEKWDCCAYATYVRFTPTTMMKTSAEDNGDEEIGTRFSM